jgi:hypothetical protein
VPITLVYNLANFLRQLALPQSIRTWNLTTLREKLVKIGAKVVAHAKSTSSSSWPRLQCRASCSPPFWSGSAGCGWRLPRGEVHCAGQNPPDVVPERPRCASGTDFGG